jgi:hypothetical protein
MVCVQNNPIISCENLSDFMNNLRRGESESVIVAVALPITRTLVLKSRGHIHRHTIDPIHTKYSIARPITD